MAQPQRQLQPEEDEVSEDVEELFSDPQTKPGEVIDIKPRLSRPLPNTQPGTEKPVDQVPKDQLADFAGQYGASNMAAGGSRLERSKNFFGGAYNAFKTGVNIARGKLPAKPSETPEQEKERKKREGDKETVKSTVKAGKAIGRLAATSGADVTAWAQLAYHGAKAAINFSKNHWQEALLALALQVLPLLLVLGLFIAGFSNLLPGTKSGTTFAQANIDSDVLTKLRLLSEGDKSSLTSYFQTHTTVDLQLKLTKLSTQVEQNRFLEGTELEAFKSNINEAIALLNQTSGTQLDEAGIATLLTQLQPIAEKIVEVIDTALAKIMGPPNTKSGFYQLPDLPDYYRKNPSREFGRQELIFTIINSAQEFKEAYPSYRLRIVDMSFAQAGNMGRSATHKCGYDADITVSHINNPGVPDGALVIGNSAFNREMAKDLANIFFNNGVKIILFNYPYNDYPQFQTNIPGHKNHMHIRIRSDWDKYPECIS